jgi:hypothetical protein
MKSAADSLRGFLLGLHSNRETAESDSWGNVRSSVVVTAYCAVMHRCHPISCNYSKTSVVAGGVEVAGVLLKDDKSSLLGSLSCLTRSATRTA